VTTDVWDDGSAYEPYVGRWSRPVAAQFLDWLAIPARSAWLDFGCGTGALSQAILAHATPQIVVACDRSRGYVAYARQHTPDPRAQFVAAELSDLPRVDRGFDAVVSGLVLNFLPEPGDGVSALAARARRGATLGAYVWDYAAGMQMLRVFWDSAIELDAAAQPLDEGIRFPMCAPQPLHRLFESANLSRVDVRPIDVPTVFRSFDDYWSPFLGGQGPAPGYARGLTPERRAQLVETIRRRLPIASDGTIPLTARAWAVRGLVS
jgi:SAM-dependent methyltransferase